jgi:hypothetical protein
MVLEENIRYNLVNNFVINFITETITDEKIKENILDEWKLRNNKLKSALRKADSHPPKRIVSKYLYFCDDERPKIKAEHSEKINIKDVTRELGKRWREFLNNPDPERMTKYTELFEADKKRYDEAKNANKLTTTIPKKKNTSAYINFCTEMRSNNPKINLKELSVEWAKVKSNPIELSKYVTVK